MTILETLFRFHSNQLAGLCGISHPRSNLASIARAAAERPAPTGECGFVAGGSRCGPCFRLARWMEEQHTLLEQDYVIVKFIGGIDEHVDEVLAQFHRSAEAGVPWFAITDTEGKPLATSEGPHGNIGFPSEQPAKLHFLMMLQKTAQRLNTWERDQLVKSLGD